MVAAMDVEAQTLNHAALLEPSRGTLACSMGRPGGRGHIPIQKTIVTLPTLLQLVAHCGLFRNLHNISLLA